MNKTTQERSLIDETSQLLDLAQIIRRIDLDFLERRDRPSVNDKLLNNRPWRWRWWWWPLGHRAIVVDFSAQSA